MKRRILMGFAGLVCATLALAQAPQSPQPPQGPGAPPPPPPPTPRRPPMERAMHPGPGGRWWNNPEMAKELSLNSDQQKRMDDIFQQNRLRLVDLTATLRREEITMEPLVGADTPDEAKILAQIDKVAQARAELEKANARFLLGIRRVLTQEQWKKLQTDHPGDMPGPAMGRGQGMRGGPGGPGGGPGGGMGMGMGAGMGHAGPPPQHP